MVNDRILNPFVSEDVPEDEEGKDKDAGDTEEKETEGDDDM